MKLRADLFIVIGIILAILLGAYNAWKEVRESPARATESVEAIPPSVTPDGEFSTGNPESSGQNPPFFSGQGAGGGGQGDGTASPSPRVETEAEALGGRLPLPGGGVGGE